MPARVTVVFQGLDQRVQWSYTLKYIFKKGCKKKARNCNSCDLYCK